jgi:co-chaperonin GroES (HSP10)
MQTSPELELENLRKSIKPTKLRIAIVKTDEQYEGIVVMPSNSNQQHKLGIVIAAGAEITTGVEIDDIIVYQVNAMFEAGITHLINETSVLFMHQGDAIGKLTSKIVTIDSFQILGDFILLDEVRIQKIGNLYLPDSALPPPEFRVLQLGATVKNSDDPLVQSIEIGDEVYIDRTRATGIRIGMKTFFYLPKTYLHGKKV